MAKRFIVNVAKHPLGCVTACGKCSSKKTGLTTSKKTGPANWAEKYERVESDILVPPDMGNGSGGLGMLTNKERYDDGPLLSPDLNQAVRDHAARTAAALMPGGFETRSVSPGAGRTIADVLNDDDSPLLVPTMDAAALKAALRGEG